MRKFIKIIETMKRLDEQNPEDEYKGICNVHAVAQARENDPGYALRYEDGYTCWLPKATFERYYFKQAKQRKGDENARLGET